MLVYMEKAGAVPHHGARCRRAGDYSFAFAGLNVGITIPTPIGLEFGLGVALKQLAYSKSGSINPATYPNLRIPQFWTPRCV